MGGGGEWKKGGREWEGNGREWEGNGRERRGMEARGGERKRKGREVMERKGNGRDSRRTLKYSVINNGGTVATVRQTQYCCEISLVIAAVIIK